MKQALLIEEPSDWGKIGISDMRKLGGTSLLNKYGGSIFQCLKSVYTGNYSTYW